VIGSSDLAMTLVDPHQLENALLNLCINARDAMPDGGQLTIETCNKWLDRAAAKQCNLDVGQYVSVCVSDTGVGMSPDVVARVFEPFFTTKPLGEGTGLGLSMVYGFARQSGGEVRIYSEEHEGTTMCLYLPCYDGSAQSADDAVQASIPSSVASGHVVLVVDDEEAIRMLLVETLEASGFTVLQAADGPKGLNLLQSSQKVDLLITDVGLPGGLNGRQVADAARVLRPNLKVLFITGYAENAVIEAAKLDRGMEVVTKPFAIAALMSKVRGALDI
jgi:CheY-like chemotaxis protein